MPSLLLHALAALALASPAAAQWPFLKLPTSPRAAAAKNHFLKGIAADHPGGVLRVIEGPEVLFERAYGASELVHSTPCEPSTLFRRQAVRNCALRLLARRLAKTEAISVDDRIAEILPALADTAADTTIEDLLEDRARYLSLENLLHFRRRNERGRITVESAVAALGRTRSLADVAHRNTNMLVLIAALEAATHSTVEELMALHVFGPGAMESAQWVQGTSDAPDGSAVNYQRRRQDEDWIEVPTSPLAANEGFLWLSARDIDGLCRVILKEKDPASLAEGVLRIAGPGGFENSDGECAVYFESKEQLTVWASNDQSRSSQSVAHLIAASIAGRHYGNAVLVIGGGAGGKYGGRFGPTPYRGRWPVGAYEIFEIEQSLVLTQDAGGRLLASTAGFEPTIVAIDLKGLEDSVFEGTTRRSSVRATSSIEDPTTGKPLVERDYDEVRIRFRLNAAGLPEPVSVTMETSGKEPRVLKDLFLVPPAR